ncbi:MAG: hypothetical protein R2851_05135 [Caldilineaceae bacterium]
MSANMHVPPLDHDGYQIRAAGKTRGRSQLYAAVTPADVRRAEGVGTGEDGKAMILDGCGIGACRRYVLEERGDITGCIHLVPGRRGTWLRVWTDTLQPDSWRIHALLRFALNTAHNESMPVPLYIGVNDYHGGLRRRAQRLRLCALSDRANMVKRYWPGCVRPQLCLRRQVEPVGEIVPSPFLCSPTCPRRCTKATAATTTAKPRPRCRAGSCWSPQPPVDRRIRTAPASIRRL